jgi:hypothetical protein
MNTEVRRKLDMAARVREFTRAHAATEPGYAPVLTRLEELLTRADGIVARQHDGRVAAGGARARRQELRRMLHAQLVHYLVAVGSVAAKDQADLAARFKLPATNTTNTAFVTAVKALLAAGEGQRDLLVKAGMAPTLLEELAKMVSDLEAASEAARTARRDHIGARADLEVITTELVEQVKLLDGITRYRFGSDPEMMAEWKAAKQLLGQPRNGEAPATPQPPAPQPGDVKQAA